MQDFRQPLKEDPALPVPTDDRSIAQAVRCVVTEGIGVPSSGRTSDESGRHILRSDWKEGKSMISNSTFFIQQVAAEQRKARRRHLLLFPSPVF